ncbi:MAG: Uma2 family endonuclease [Phototrophicales bacterium]|nr:Uma2 family endonuclease [Phototrophicales bacterium]
MLDIALRKMTLPEFAQFIQLPENANKTYELIQGSVIEMPAPSPVHAYIGGIIYATILHYLRQHPLGFAFPDSVSYILLDDTEVIPDVSFISYQHQKTLPEKFTIPPDLAVEVVSPSNRPRQMLNKIELYLKSGTQLVWVIYPDEKVADVYRMDEDGRLISQKLTSKDSFSGEDVLPEFALPLKDIFPPSLE